MIEQGFNGKNSIMLAMLTLAFIIGECSHFLLGVLSKEMAQDIGFGKKACMLQDDVDTELKCNDYDSELE